MSMTADQASLERALAAMLPQCLDDIVRQHRDLCSIHLSSDEDIDGLSKCIIADDADIKDEIEDWRIICYDRIPKYGGKAHLLIGHAILANCSWGTSPITAIDLGTGLATTNSGSIYRLRGPQGEGEPPMIHLLHVCAMLHQWGAGPVLGVPHVFY